MPEFTHLGIRLSLPEAFAAPALVEKLTDGTYERDEGQAALRCVKPGFRVLELGAGMGFVTSICAKQAGAENVLSIEANPAMIPVIEANLALNGQSGVSLIHAAVAGRAGPEETAPFRIGNALTSSRLAGPSVTDGIVNVPLVGIADLIATQRPHVVIMDVEGAEAQLFDRKWKCPLRFLVLELHPKQYGSVVIKRIVDWASAMDMTYDPGLSRGKTLGFRKVWGKDDTGDDRLGDMDET